MRLPHVIIGVAKLEKCLILRQTHVMRLYGNHKNKRAPQTLICGARTNHYNPGHINLKHAL